MITYTVMLKGVNGSLVRHLKAEEFEIKGNTDKIVIFRTKDNPMAAVFPLPEVIGIFDESAEVN